MKSRSRTMFFSGSQFDAQSRTYTEKAGAETRKLTDDEVLNGDLDIISQQIAAKHSIVVPTLALESGELPKYRRDGDYIEFSIPFKGDAVWFSVNPRQSYSPSEAPSGNIAGQTLVLDYSVKQHSGEEMHATLHSDIAKINKYLQELSNKAQLFNKKLPGILLSSLQQRREQIINDNSIESQLDKLGYKPAT